MQKDSREGLGGGAGSGRAEHSLISYDLVLDATTQLKHRSGGIRALSADTASKLNYRGFFTLSHFVSRSPLLSRPPFFSFFFFFILDTTFPESHAFLITPQIRAMFSFRILTSR